MIEKFQFVQTKPGKLLLKIVPDPRFDRSEVVESFFQEIWNRLDNKSLEIIAEYVDHIPATQSGKTRPFIQQPWL